MSLPRSLSHCCCCCCSREKLSGPDVKKSGSPNFNMCQTLYCPYVQGPAAQTRMHTCQVRPFSFPVSKNSTQSGPRVTACLSASIWATSQLCTCNPALMHGSPAANLTIFTLTTGCAGLFPLVCLDIQTSSCPKPPDPLTLCLCHCKQEAGDSGGGGARSGSQTCLMGSLEENKYGGEFSFFQFFCAPKVTWHLLGQGFLHQENCSRSSEWLKQPQAERYL